MGVRLRYIVNQKKWVFERNAENHLVVFPPLDSNVTIRS